MSKNSSTAVKAGPLLLWGIVWVAAFATTTPKPWLLTFVGLVFGWLVGHMRSRTDGTGRAAKVANVLPWLFALGLLVLAMAVSEDMFMGAGVAGLAGFLLASCAYSLRAGYRKQLASPGATTGGT